MKHRDQVTEQDDLLQPRLVNVIDMRHKLVTPMELIDWERFGRESAEFFLSKEGRLSTHQDWSPR